MAKTVALAAAGSAGHVEPALAVARSLSELEPEWTCVIIGGNTGIEQKLVPQAGYQLRVIPKVTMPRKLSPAALLFPFRLLKAIAKTFSALKDVDLLVGFGGYVAAPSYIAARIKRIPIVIHEANAKPGWANRLGAYLTENVTIAFASARQTGDHWLDAEVVGMPIRASIARVQSLSAESRAEVRARVANELGFDSSRPIVLVFGGSLGAQRINEAIASALPSLLADGVQVIHGVGGGNHLPPARDGYSPHPYLSAMADYYVASDLVISRCGAVTCAELQVVGTYALLIPLPIGNGEQRANGEELVLQGSAEILENSLFTGSWLVGNINRLLDKARSFPRPQRDPAEDPAQKLALMIRDLA